MEPFQPDNPLYDDAPDELVYWTARRLIYAVIAIIVIIALLAMISWPFLYGLIAPPQPMPTPLTPLPRV